MAINKKFLKLAKSFVEVCPTCEGEGTTEYLGLNPEDDDYTEKKSILDWKLCPTCSGVGEIDPTVEPLTEGFRDFNPDDPDWVEKEEEEIEESDAPFIDYYSRYSKTASKKRVDLDVRPHPSPLFKNYDYTNSGPNETSPGGSPYFGIPGGGEKSMGDWIKKRRKKERRRKRKRILSLLLIPSILKTANILKEAAAWAGYNRALAKDPAGVETVLRVADKLQLSRRELAWIIERESGWNSAAWNRPKSGDPNKGASGLIQFMPSTLRYLGWKESPAEFRKLSLTEQAPWVESFYRRGPRPRVQGDLYVATFMPKFVGHADDAIIAEPGSVVWKANAVGLREGGDGPITARSVRAWARPPITGGPGSAPSEVPASQPKFPPEEKDDVYELINQLFSAAA